MGGCSAKEQFSSILRGDWGEVVLREAFPRHAAAVEEYRFFVRPNDQAAYDKAWRDYYEVGGSVRFFDYSSKGSGGSFDQFEKRVQAIFKLE
jgi:hypothetical protein